jgi:hypothetical protein
MDIRGQIEAIPMGQIKLHLGPSCGTLAMPSKCGRSGLPLRLLLLYQLWS